jgi:hypothetical protein
MIQPKTKQSLIDIAVELCGNLEAVWEIAEVNQLSLTEDLSVEQTVEIPTVSDQRVKTLFRSEKHSPATAVTDKEVEEEFVVGGIGYWFVGYDFVVS